MSVRGRVLPYQRRLKLLISFLFIAALPSAVSSPAAAATQILGLAMTAGPVELNCAGSECAAEFSSFCLQQDRKRPGHEAPYELATDQDVTLTLTAANGEAREVAPEGLIRIVTKRGFSAVRISVGRQVLSAFGAERAAITIGERVALLPVPEASDPSPLTADEIAQATGPARAIAAGYFDGEEGYAGVTRVLARAINTVAPDERMSPAQRQERWDAALQSLPGGADRDAIAMANEHFQGCQRWIGNRLVFGLRSCLENRHDSMMRGLNIRFWKTLEPGS